MSAAPARSFSLLAAAIVVAAIVISATLFVALGTPATVTKTTTSTQVNISTVVETTTITSILTNSGATTYTPPQMSQRVTILNDIWNFTAFINANMVSQSDYLFVTASLTNISPVNQTISQLVQPTIYPSIYAANGSSVWTWEPPQSTWPNYTIAKGQNLGEEVSIPMSALSIGQSYSLRISPMSIATATNMTITMSFVVTSGSSLPSSKVVSLLDVNGSWYWAADISNDIVIGAPGYSYFLNGSVTFDGVKFQTICPSNYRDCPGSNSSSTIVLAGAIQFSMTFPDGTNETVGSVIGDSIYTYVFSQHSSPRSGMLIEYVNDYPHNSEDYAVFLLVSSCGGPPHLC